MSPLENIICTLTNNVKEYRFHAIDEKQSIQAELVRAKDVFYETDLNLVERLIKLYQHAKSHYAGQKQLDIWQEYIVPEFKAFFFALEKNYTKASLAKFNDMHINELSKGFVSLPAEISEVFDKHEDLKRQYALFYMDTLVCFAEYLGIVPVEAMEQGVWGKALAQDPNYYIKLMERKLGFNIAFPAFQNGLPVIQTYRGGFTNRHFIYLYLALKVKDFCTQHGIENPRICEIGCGLGYFAFYLDLVGIKDITLIDIPSTSIVSSYFLMKNMPHRTFNFSDENQCDPLAIKILFDTKFQEFGKNSFDIIVNCDSFPEINQDITLNYLSQIWNTSTYFYSVNQEAQGNMWHSDAKQSNVHALLSQHGAMPLSRNLFGLQQGYTEEVYQCSHATLQKKNTIPNYSSQNNELVDIRKYMNLNKYHGADCVTSRVHEAFKNNKRYLSGKWEHYLAIYDRIFAPYMLRQKPVSLLEVGILNGGSLEIWQNILPPKSQIVGADINPNCKSFSYDENVNVYIGDISRGELVNNELKNTMFDIIIDDASHFCDNVIANFHMLFDKLNWGGIYVIEDCSTSYWPYYQGEYKAPHSTIEYFKNMADIVNYTYIDKDKILPENRSIFHKLSQQIASVAFYDSVIVIEKYTKQKENAFRNYVSGSEGSVASKPQLLEYGHIECNATTSFEKFYTQVDYENTSLNLSHSQNTDVLSSHGEENILFSLLIPTKDRLDLLKYAVDSILQQEYGNWEIIISDNCSKEDVQGYVESLQDARIKYIRQEQPVSVTDNWNTANDLASGDYIIMLGDDDALLPWTLKELHTHIMQYDSPEVLNFGAYIYHQANISEKNPHCEVTRATENLQYLRVVAPYFLSQVKRVEFVQSSLNFVFLFGFNMQYFCCHKNVVTTLKKYGKFYEPPYPDYYTANALMLVAQEVLIIPQDLVIIGVTPKSYGAYYHNNKEKEGMAFHNEADYRERALASVKDKLCNIAEMQTAAMATFAILARRFPQYVQLNFAAYYNAVIERITTDYPKEQALAILQAELMPLIPVQDQELVMQHCVHATSRVPSSKAPPKQSLHLPSIVTLIENIVEKRKKKEKIDVVYLARGTDYGIQEILNFIQTYNDKSAGTEHTLHIIAKGWDGKESELKALRGVALRVGARVIELPDDGLDFGAYYRASLQLTGEYVFFLSTSSRIEHDNWLRLFVTHASDTCKLVGCFGSYELPPLQTAYLQQRMADIYAETGTTDNDEFQICKQYFLRYKKNPLLSPNYHIRSNAFLIDRALFMEFMEQNDIPAKIPRFKEDAWHLESGHNSLTQYVMQKGYACCVVGADGKNYTKEHWYESNTFRRYNVSNAIISDKQSREFVTLFDEKKVRYVRSTWGETNVTQMLQGIEQTLDCLKIFVNYHKKNHLFSTNFLLPIQSGAENAMEDLGFLRDNIGEHISHKNKYFGKLTTHYWVWKTYLLLNPHIKYVGFAQYRKFFDLDPEKMLGKPSTCNEAVFEENQFVATIERAYHTIFLYSSFAAYDMTLARIMDFSPTTVWDDYLITHKHPLQELENFIGILLTNHPEYKESVQEVLGGTHLYLTSVFVMRKKLFEEFCAWIFPLLFALEDMSDWSQYDDTYNEKIAAYLHERAFNIWLVHKLKSTPLAINEKRLITFDDEQNHV